LVLFLESIQEAFDKWRLHSVAKLNGIFSIYYQQENKLFRCKGVSWWI